MTLEEIKNFYRIKAIEGYKVVSELKTFGLHPDLDSRYFCYNYW